MNDAVDEFVDRSRTISVSDDVVDLGPGHRPDNVQLRRVRDPERHHLAFAKAHRNVGLLDAWHTSGVPMSERWSAS